MSSSTRTFTSLVSCCALLTFLGFSQTACAPKQDVPVPEEVTESDSVELDIALAISRELYLFTNGKPAGNTAKFMDFMLDPQLGQQDVLKAGYIPLAK